MNDEKPKPKITVIPAARQPEKWIAIYCRVSTAYESQEKSLDIQTATLKQAVAYNPKWKLYHIYTNSWRRNHFSSGKPPNQQKSSLSMV